MKRSRGFVLVASVSALVVGLSACSGGQGGGDAGDGGDGIAPVTLRVPTLYGPDHFQTVAMAAYADAVETASDGAISFEFFYQDALVKPADTVSALRDGVVDIALVVPNYTPSDFPIDQWTTRFSFLQSDDPIVSSLQSTAAILDWSSHDEDQIAEYEALGLVPIIPRFFGHDSYHLLCIDEVVALDDAEGTTVRVGGPVWTEETAALGMVGVALAGAEIYEGFQRGIIDCFAGSAPDMLGLSLGEVGKHYTQVGMSGVSGLGLMASSVTWESLPLEVQQILWDEAVTFLEVWHTGYIEKMHDWFTNDAYGLQFHIADDDLLTALHEHQQKQLAAAVDTAPTQLTDPAASTEAFEAAFAEWLPIVRDELGYGTDYATWVEWAQQTTDPTIDLSAWSAAITDILNERRPN